MNIEYRWTPHAAYRQPKPVLHRTAAASSRRVASLRSSRAHVAASAKARHRLPSAVIRFCRRYSRRLHENRIDTEMRSFFQQAAAQPLEECLHICHMPPF